ncbi:MAG: hypothetical protein BM557_09490 [Flavobacterium sp. MedPE-SWcel]|uniref:hypothetical protein n=1 Tax=uncultured Flavobacterium sp. TaxID=165435 RepID=UPI000914EE89|nr:hypothetical protein [uncultured Flavobacterium sp.]OIQ16537.1 MAG: hypothetical protein BM557_09490 [Flavobacterium sp. MedPE-SWcel]
MKYIPSLLLLFILLGCKTRQVEKHSKKERIDTIEQYLTTAQEKDLSTTKVDEQTEKRVHNQSITFIDAESFTLTPVDSTEPISIIAPNGTVTTVQNAIIKGTRIKQVASSSSNASELKNISKKQQNNIAKNSSNSGGKTTKTHIITDSKNVTAKSSILDYWWLYIILFIVGRYFYKRMKKK